jgi:hypothetical protein
MKFKTITFKLKKNISIDKFLLIFKKYNIKPLKNSPMDNNTYIIDFNSDDSIKLKDFLVTEIDSYEWYLYIDTAEFFYILSKVFEKSPIIPTIIISAYLTIKIFEIEKPNNWENLKMDYVKQIWYLIPKTDDGFEFLKFIGLFDKFNECNIDKDRHFPLEITSVPIEAIKERIFKSVSSLSESSFDNNEILKNLKM